MIDAAREYVWSRLAEQPLRRSILGRDRCDAIVRVAIDNMPADGEMLVAGPGTDTERFLRFDVEQKVRDQYRERCGFAFTTLILSWAISAIVQALVIRWWENRHKELS